MRNSLLGALATVVALVPLEGQVISGRSVDREGVPLRHTYIVLADSAGTDVFRGITNADGRFEVPAPGPGQYWVRAERIGYRIPETESVTVGAGQRRNVTLRVTPRALTLSDLSMSSGRQCRPLEETSETVRRLWSEVGKALNATWFTASFQSHNYQTHTFERDLALDGETIRGETVSPLSDQRALPFATGRPEQLATTGYADGDETYLNYFMPDPETLLHPTFAATHCFGLAREAEGGRIGVTFAPRRGRTIADIGGTMWLRAADFALDRIEFRYVNDPSELDHERVGGALHFASLAPAGWFVRRWVLRMPSVGTDPDGDERILMGFRELGGEVIEITNTEREALYRRDGVAVVSGTIFDSTQAVPLEGAVVALAGTDHWAVSDARGEFALAAPVQGRYQVVFGHPRLDSLGFVSVPRPLDLALGTREIMTIAVPSLPTIISRRCGGPMAAADRRVLLGVVRDGEGRPVPGAAVTVAWRVIPADLQRFGVSDLGATAITDSLGTYALCDVPISRTITVHASDQDRASDFVHVAFGPSAIRIRDRATLPLDRPVGRLDLTLVPASERQTAIAGRVVNAETGEPVEDAVIQLENTAFSVSTNRQGAFQMAGVPPGPLTLTVRRLGYRVLRRELEMTDGLSLALPDGALHLVPLTSDVTTLDPIIVEAQRVVKLAGFEERRRRGLGSFASMAEFERWNPSATTDVLRRMHGIHVLPNRNYGVNGDFRRFIIQSSRDMGGRTTRVIERDQRTGAQNLSGATNIAVNECPVLLFMDGAFIGDTQIVDVDTILNVTTLSAVEVYNASQVPARFSLPGATCGVVVFWTR